MQKNYTLNILLAAVVGLASLAALLCRVFLPAVILPVVSLPAVAALVLIALVLECYLTKPIPQRDWGVTGLLGALTFGALTFGLLPFGAGLTAGGEAVRLAVVGGTAFLVLTFLFTTLRERLVSGRAGRLAPLVTGGVLFLACQCFIGMVL